jgi:NAD(P)-dependent dehydrogenase (short-subunit alcohol dehydrogenase family)
MKRAVIVTGSSGGVGRGIVAAFCEAGWRTVGVDLPDAGPSGADVDVPIDLRSIASDESVGEVMGAELRAAAGNAVISCLVNNAAVQRLGSVSELQLHAVRETMDVNLVAPLRLSQVLLADLEACGGSIVNVSSVHATATKAGFVAYAASKAALSGLTRAMAVDLGGRVRVNAIELGATRTPMLEAGFKGRAEKLQALAHYQPIGRLASPIEVGRVVLVLADPELGGFITGSCMRLDGGVTARLHDPV